MAVITAGLKRAAAEATSRVKSEKSAADAADAADAEVAIGSIQLLFRETVQATSRNSNGNSKR